MNVCKFPECNRRVKAYGLCQGHHRQHKLGHVLHPLIPRGENPIVLDEDGKSAWIILLDLKGGEKARSQIDVADIATARAYRWRLSTARPLRVVGRAPRCSTTVFLSCLLVPAGAGQLTDHVNGNALDNRRRNLRVVPTKKHMQNIAHAARPHLRGVEYNPRASQRPWSVRIMVDRVRYYVGCFASEEHAIAAARKFRAEFQPYANEARHRRA